MQTFLAVCLVLIATAIAQQASAVCTSDATCNNYGTLQQQRCEIPVDPLAAVCQARGTFQYRSTNTDGKAMCKDSLNFGAGAIQICGGYGVAGCSVPLADISYVNCISGTFRNAVTEKCENNNATTPIQTKGLGERCNMDALTDPKIGCGNNLICVNYVCRQKLQLGDNCLSSPYGCGNGMVCDRELCTIAYSKVAQDPCSTSTACVSGVCQDGRCQEKRSIPCYNNADCSGSSDNVCYIKSGESRGYCTNNIAIARFRWNMCTYNQCSAVKATSEDCTACEKSYVDYVCAQQCINRPDLRKQNDGYSYNCQASTRTKITTGCDIKATITGCDTVPLSGAFTQALSFVVVIVAALMVIA